MCFKGKRGGQESNNSEGNVMVLHRLANLKQGSIDPYTLSLEPLKKAEKIEAKYEFGNQAEDAYEDISQYMGMS